jgi:UDP-N-acetyl-alpha-D-quinovosamine dehydrogenase
VTAVVRRQVALPKAVRLCRIDELGGGTPWGDALTGCDAVVHMAARVHVMRDGSADPLTEYRKVNVLGTQALARQAAAAGVKRFILLSSIKVNGERTQPGRPFTAEDDPRPEDAYGVSKYEAECVLHEISAATGMDIVIIRPPLVYGPGVRANFRVLMNAVARGIPLPLGAIHNRRSLIALDTLVDFIITCLNHPAAANATFVVSDGEDLSTTDLIRRLARAMGRPARLVAVPAFLLRAVATLIGKRDMAQRLLGSLEVDISKARQLLKWSPPISVDEGLRRAVASHM